MNISMATITKIQWGDHPRQRLSYACPHPNEIQNKWLIIIHGGAWVDERITDESGHTQINNCLHKYNGVASIDYRLAPHFQYPHFLEDSLAGIKYILTKFNPQSIDVLGHSCGVYVAGLLYPLINQDHPRIFQKLIAVEGIFDLRDLIQEYEDYKSFVYATFGNQPLKYPPPYFDKIPELITVQSLKDELLSPRQSSLVSNYVKTAYTLYEGKHDQVFEEFDLSKFV